MSVAVSGNYAYVADYDCGLRIINVSNPAAPVEIGFCDTPGLAYGVAVSGSYAYVADRDEGLRIINVRNPAAPVETGFCDTPGLAYNVAVEDDYVYVADYGAGLRIISVSNPGTPLETGFYDTPRLAFDVVVKDGFACVADFDSGLRIINVSNPACPVESGFYDTPGDAYGVAVDRGVAYVADCDYFGIYDCSSALAAHCSVASFPSSYSLSSYPNPFNSSTQIRFDVPKAGLVDLKVYDIEGRLVETLASRVFGAGSHTLTYDTSGRASGAYFVRMASGEFTTTQKIVFLK
jgi:hypothetical protein